MIYLTGSAPKDPELYRSLVDGGVGYMASFGYGGQHRRMIAEMPCWAADNGCYTRPHRFDLTRYLKWLSGLADLAGERCLFAVAPDAFGDGEETLRISAEVLPLIRAAGLPAAFVAQPGLPEVPWDLLDVLFIGGTDAFRAEHAPGLVARATALGKRAHLGRVNSARRFGWARGIGCASVDGTFIAFAPNENAPRVLKWTRGAQQLALPL